MKTKSNEYKRVHEWLRKTYGKATLCEHCTSPKGRCNWALKKGFDHAKERDHYLQLCQSCHVKYDITEETRLKISMAMTGKQTRLGIKHTAESIEKMRIAKLGNQFKKGKTKCVSISTN